MSEKYYVVSDRELQELSAAASSGNDNWHDKSYDACRARPVRMKSIFSHNIGEHAITWEEIKK